MDERKKIRKDIDQQVETLNDKNFKRDAKKLALQSAAARNLLESQVSLKAAEEIYQWLIKDL